MNTSRRAGFLCGTLDHKCSQCHLFKAGVVDDTCVPYGKWLYVGYPTLGSAHGKHRETSDNGEWRIEALRFSPGLGHDPGTDVVEETGDHSKQAMVGGEASMRLGSKDIAGGV